MKTDWPLIVAAIVTGAALAVGFTVALVALVEAL